MGWMNKYQPEEYFKVFDVPDGDHVVKIVKVEYQVSKTGKNMHVLTYDVYDSNGVPFIDRIVEGEFYNVNMTRFFDAFKIQRGNFNFNSWLGKTAYAYFQHKEETYTDVQGMQKKINKVNLVYFRNNMPEENPTVNVDFNRSSASASNGQFNPGGKW